MVNRFIRWLVREYILPEIDRQIAEEFQELTDQLIVEFHPDPQFEADASTKH